VDFSRAYTPSSYVSPSILLENKVFVEVYHEIRIGFRLFDGSSLNLNSTTIKYRNLQYDPKPPNIKFPRVVSNKNKNKLFFYGTNEEDILFESSVMYSYDINENTWKEIKDLATPTHLMQNHEEQFIGPDNEGKAYLYSDADTMFVFDTENLSWTENTFPTTTLLPLGYTFFAWYTATLLPSGEIVFIGGNMFNFF